MKDAWLDFDDLQRSWLGREIFAEQWLPLRHRIESYVETHFVGAFLVPENRVDAVKNSTSTGWEALHSAHPLLADGNKHFLSLSIRRSADLNLSGWHAYAQGSEKVAERKWSDSNHVKQSGVFISRPLLNAYAARKRLRLGFWIDSIRYSERSLAEVGPLDDDFRPPHAFFRRIRQDQFVVGGPRMQVRSLFWGKAFV